MRGAVRLTGVGFDSALEAHHGFDHFGDFDDSLVHAGTDIGEVGRVLDLQAVDDRPAQIVDVHQFPPLHAGAPNGDALGSGFLGFVEAPDQGGQQVAVLWVVVVPGAIEVSRHQ